MKTLTAIVSDSKRLELCEDLSIPAGTRIRIRIEEDEGVEDFAAQLVDYSTEEALQEERALLSEGG
jgi:hypothetical protein